MQLTDWMPALTTTGLLSAALFLSRELVVTRLKRSVQYDFDHKLELLKSEFRAAEKAMESSLAQKNAELESLRAGALSGITQRQALLHQRRIEAIDQLWGALVRNQGARSLAMTMSVMKLDNIAEMIGSDERLRDFIRISGGGFDPSKLDYQSASLARPYVSDMAWALFSAMQAITSYYVAHWVALKNGIDSRKMIANDSVSRLVLAVVPEYKQYLETHGVSASYHLLERLDTLLLDELKRISVNYQQDKESVEQAAEILRHAQSLSQGLKSEAADQKINEFQDALQACRSKISGEK